MKNPVIALKGDGNLRRELLRKSRGRDPERKKLFRQRA